MNLPKDSRRVASVVTFPIALALFACVLLGTGQLADAHGHHSSGLIECYECDMGNCNPYGIKRTCDTPHCVETYKDETKGVLVSRGCGTGPGVGCQTEGEFYHCYCGKDLCNRRLARVMRSTTEELGSGTVGLGVRNHFLIAVCIATAWTMFMLSRAQPSYVNFY